VSFGDGGGPGIAIDPPQALVHDPPQALVQNNPKIKWLCALFFIHPEEAAPS